MYDVQWTEPALDQLAVIWLDATDRDAITAAILTLDRMLASNPENTGESRSGMTRVLIEPLIVAWFDIDPAARTVTVVSVRPRRR